MIAQQAISSASSFESSFSSALGDGATLGASAATAGITAGVGLVLGLGMSLLAAHDQRYKDAKDENAAVAQAVVVFDNDIRTIFAALNAGTISEDEAIQYLQQTENSYWSYVGQYAGKPGVASKPCPPHTGGPVGHGACGQANVCDKTCTAGCCVGCGAIEGAIANAIAIIQAGGGTFTVCPVFPSAAKYGNPGRPAYNLTYVKPSILAGTSGAVDGFLNLLGLGGNQSSSPLAANLTPIQGSPNTSKLATYGLLFLVGAIIFKKVLA